MGAISYRVIVTPDALLFWWGADSGPQTAEGVVAQHWVEIEAAVSARLAKSACGADGLIIIDEDDIE